MDSSSNPPRVPHKPCVVPGCTYPEGHTHTAAEWGRVLSHADWCGVGYVDTEKRPATEQDCTCGLGRSASWRGKWRCRDCGRIVRVRRDGRAARHAGFDRFGKASVRCTGSLFVVTTPARTTSSEGGPADA